MMTKPLLRTRRGATAAIALIGLGTILVTVGAGMDTGTLVVTRHKDQTIADAAALAALSKLPYKDQAQTVAQRVINAYQAGYRSNLPYTLTFYPTGAAVPTQVVVQVNESPAMFIPNLMGTATRTTKANAAVDRTLPASLLTGAVPLGVQYDMDFDLPAAGTSSPKAISLKVNSSGNKPTPGNFYALDFNGSGATDWSTWLKLGYTSKLSVGDTIQTETGNMVGPTNQALATDLDARMTRAAVSPWADDTYDNIDPGNPRVVVVPLVDWKSSKSGKATFAIKGFAAFWIDDYNKGSGAITGRFVRYVVPKNATAGDSWGGVSIDPTTTGSYDGGLWSGGLTQ